MKKRFAVFIILCALTLLTACASDEVSPYKSSQINTDPNIVMTTVFPIYDDSARVITVQIENCGNTVLDFGQHWQLEKKNGSRWTVLEQGGWEDIAYSLDGGQTRYQSCTVAPDLLTDGTYRIVKLINNGACAAEFTVGTSPVTSEAPYGFEPLENIPIGYRTDEAIADGITLIRRDEILHGESITAFFNEWYAFGYHGQLRVAVETETGLLLTDILYQDQRITWRTADRRSDAVSSEVTTAYFSFVHVHDGALYLSNHAEFGDHKENVRLFHDAALPSSVTEGVTPYRDPNVTPPVLKVWSPEGTQSVTLNQKGETYVNGSTWGTIFGGKFTGMDILEILWTDETTFMIVAKTDHPLDLYFYEYIRATSPSDVETLGYTTSQHMYQIHDGEILIPE